LNIVVVNTNFGKIKLLASEGKRFYVLPFVLEKGKNSWAYISLAIFSRLLPRFETPDPESFAKYDVVTNVISPYL